MGRCAVVTGGGRGIGAAIVDRLRIDGYRVMPLDLYESDGVTICDVAAPAAIEAAAASSGATDLLVNNAAIWLFAALEDVTEADFGLALDVNLKGAFHCVQSFGRPMLEQGSGTIVNIVSIAAKHANPAVGSYGPSKVALLSLTEQIALEWAPQGIRGDAVGPGLVPTPETGTVYDDPQVQAV